MKGQGGKPEARFGRASALHIGAHFLSTEDAKQSAVLAAHRYARRAIELQDEDGTYCSTNVAFGTENQCKFDPESHCLAVLYASRLLAVCKWTALREVLTPSVTHAATRLASW